MAMQFLRRLPSSFDLRIFPFSPQPSISSQLSICRIHENSVRKVFQEGKGGTLCDEVTHQKAISQKVSLQILCEDISFSPWAAMVSHILLCRIHDSSVSKLFQEGKGGTLCDEVTHQEAISQIASIQLFCEDTSFFTMGPLGLPNITFRNPRKECSETAS